MGQRKQSADQLSIGDMIFVYGSFYYSTGYKILTRIVRDRLDEKFDRYYFEPSIKRNQHADPGTYHYILNERTHQWYKI
jgi:hypothetical protein